ncbi:S-methyl-5'-thioadenosine phosphorylase [bacterium]|nr:S-methyl-5'-thioadenosine phosphorylase [bacterium]
MERTGVEIGIFGGSGLYKLLDGAQEIEVDTPFGEPSAPLAVGEIGGRKVAFLPRHGIKHQFPPHRINYRANLWAMKAAGVRRIIAPCAAGSLQPDVARGMFVICDQLVDRTRHRTDTFYDGPKTTHVAFADPYCPELRSAAIAACGRLGIPFRPAGTVVVIEGPRFSTRAESKWFSGQGWEVVNMTQYPEAILARELELCYVNISLITDYDVGLEGDPSLEPVTQEEVLRVFKENNEKLRGLLNAMIPEIPEKPSCGCQSALEGAQF